MSPAGSASALLSISAVPAFASSPLRLREKQEKEEEQEKEQQRRQRAVVHELNALFGTNHQELYALQTLPSPLAIARMKRLATSSQEYGSDTAMVRAAVVDLLRLGEGVPALLDGWVDFGRVVRQRSRRRRRHRHAGQQPAMIGPFCAYGSESTSSRMNQADVETLAAGRGGAARRDEQPCSPLDSSVTSY